MFDECFYTTKASPGNQIECIGLLLALYNNFLQPLPGIRETPRESRVRQQACPPFPSWLGLEELETCSSFAWELCLEDEVCPLFLASLDFWARLCSQYSLEFHWALLERPR